MWKERPARAHAPRRLARTEHPHGGVWVVHSVYLEKDTMNRDRSYFSHLLHLPAADPAAVLRSWDATSGRRSTRRGAAKALPAAGCRSAPRLRDALAAFLSDARKRPDRTVGHGVPGALRADSPARRELVGRFLQA